MHFTEQQVVCRSELARESAGDEVTACTLPSSCYRPEQTPRRPLFSRHKKTPHEAGFFNAVFRYYA